ncbi:MAG: SDR family NAD(P)-dependent oxidoreductase [Chitinophagaceae bacterium]
MKTIIVSGASGNLGQAVIKKFLTEDYFVSGTIIPIDPVRIEIENKNFESVVVDLLDEGAVNGYAEQVIARNESIDAAVLTAGGFAMGKISETHIAEIQKQIKLNFETAYNLARAVFMQMMKQGKGRIFLIGSRPGYDMKHSKGMVAYGLSKSLIFRLADLMNDEAKGTDVVTSVVVPSTIDTPQNRQSMPDADFSKWVKPESIANVIYFYCSREAAILREPIIKVYGNS